MAAGGQRDVAALVARRGVCGSPKGQGNAIAVVVPRRAWVNFSAVCAGSPPRHMLKAGRKGAIQRRIVHASKRTNKGAKTRRKTERKIRRSDEAARGHASTRLNEQASGFPLVGNIHHQRAFAVCTQHNRPPVASCARRRCGVWRVFTRRGCAACNTPSRASPSGCGT